MTQTPRGKRSHGWKGRWQRSTGPSATGGGLHAQTSREGGHGQHEHAPGCQLAVQTAPMPSVGWGDVRAGGGAAATGPTGAAMAPRKGAAAPHSAGCWDGTAGHGGTAGHAAAAAPADAAAANAAAAADAAAANAQHGTTAAGSADSPRVRWAIQATHDGAMCHATHTCRAPTASTTAAKCNSGDVASSADLWPSWIELASMPAAKVTTSSTRNTSTSSITSRPSHASSSPRWPKTRRATRTTSRAATAATTSLQTTTAGTTTTSQTTTADSRATSQTITAATTSQTTTAATRAGILRRRAKESQTPTAWRKQVWVGVETDAEGEAKSRRAEGDDSAKTDAQVRRTEGEDSAQADAKYGRTEKRGEDKRGEEKRGRALEAKHLAQSLLLFSLLSMIFECLPPKRLNRDPAVDPRTTSFLMFELTLCQSCLWQPVQPYYWDILRSFLSWFFRKEEQHLHRLGQSAVPRRGALKRAWTWHCAERDNTLCWKAQRTVLKSTTHCAEKHNALFWKAQHTVLKSTTHRAEKHNTPCWKAQRTVLKSTNSLWWQALLLVLGHCMSFVLMIVVQAAKHEAGTSPTGASSASKARDFILGWLKDANKTQEIFAEKAPPWLFFKKMMFQLVSFLKLRRCMTVILPFCVHTHLMQSPPFVKGAAPKSSSATQWVLMRGLIFFTTCCNLHFFWSGKKPSEKKSRMRTVGKFHLLEHYITWFWVLFFQDAGSTMVPLPKKKKEHPTEEKVKAW